MRPVIESDWKHLNKLREKTLHELCTRILDEVHSMSAPENRNHDSLQQYRDIFRYIDKMDGEISNCFDDWKRSTVFEKVQHLKKNNLLNEDDFMGFSEDTRALIHHFFLDD